MGTDTFSRSVWAPGAVTSIPSGGILPASGIFLPCPCRLVLSWMSQGGCLPFCEVLSLYHFLLRGTLMTVLAPLVSPDSQQHFLNSESLLGPARSSMSHSPVNALKAASCGTHEAHSAFFACHMKCHHSISFVFLGCFRQEGKSGPLNYLEWKVIFLLGMDHMAPTSSYIVILDWTLEIVNFTLLRTGFVIFFQWILELLSSVLMYSASLHSDFCLLSTQWECHALPGFPSIHCSSEIASWLRAWETPSTHLTCYISLRHQTLCCLFWLKRIVSPTISKL